MSFLDRVNGAMKNPLFHMGLGILAANPERGALGALGTGGLLGMQSQQQYLLGDQEQQMNQQRLSDLDMRRERLQSIQSPEFQQQAAGMLGPQGEQMMGFLGKYFPESVPELMTQMAMNAAQPEKLPADIQTANYLNSLDPADRSRIMDTMMELNKSKAQSVHVGGTTVYPATGAKVSPFQAMNQSTLSETLKGYQEAGPALFAADQGLQVLGDLIAQGAPTGQWADLRKGISKFLGLDPNSVASYEVFNSQMGEVVLEKLKAFTGAISEGERAYAISISPGTKLEPFTNFVLLNILRNASLRAQDKHQKMLNFLKEKGAAAGAEELADFTFDYKPPEELAFNLNKLRGDFNKLVGSRPLPMVNPGHLKK